MVAATPPGSFEFSPPTSYAFEPELRGPAPRPIPEAVRNGPYAQKRRDAVRGLLAFGAVALVLDLVPGIDVLGLYVLPLAYLSWIGYGALALAGLAWLDARVRLGPYRYVRDGVPLVVRVVDLVMGPSHIVNGQPTLYAYTAALAFNHPETAVPCTVQVRSEGFPAARRAEYDTPFRIGDYVTAVYLPRRFEKSLRLYAFLGLRPETSLLRRATAAASPWRVAIGVLALALLFVVVFANLYAFGRYEPLDLDFDRAAAPFAAGALLLGGAGLYGIHAERRREQQRIRERNARASAGAAVEIEAPAGGGGVHGFVVRIVVALGMPLVGGVTALCWAFLANAWLDVSPAVPRPARVTEMTMTTHAFLLRDYSLTYALDGSEETHDMLSTPQHLMLFEDEHAVAQVRAGRFGWPWVETVLPAEPAPQPET